MKVVQRFPSTLPAVVTTVGEVIDFHEGNGGVFFRVIWYGRPGVHTIHHSELEVVK